MVRVRAFGGIELVRRVIFVKGDVVAVCSEEEYDKARAEKRRPGCIGFKAHAVLAVVPQKLATL